jgi:2-keto-3-deoxy-L-rhamnonate aldolase RhmA
VRSAPGALSTSSLRARPGGNEVITVRNHAKERLEAGELALGVGLRQARTVDIARIMKTAGYDFLFIDMEHNSMSIDLAAQISVAAQDAGITPVVRVPDFQHFHATRALDAGAQGIVVPHVDTPEVAARMVQPLQVPADRPSLGHRRPAAARLQAGAAG